MIVFIEFHDGRLFNYGLNDDSLYFSIKEVWDFHVQVMEHMREAGHTNFAAEHDDFREVKQISIFPGAVRQVIKEASE